MRKVKTKWANYILTGVRYDRNPQGGRHIVAVQVTTHGEGKLSPLGVWERQTLVRQIDLHKFNCITAHPTESGRWRKGSVIRTPRVNGTVYLRVDDAEIPEDDLGPLPEF